MKAVVYHGLGDIRLDNESDPKLKDPQDAIVRITSSAICGTDLHMVRGTFPGMKSGTILGHEGVGVDANRPHGDIIQQAKSLLQTKTFNQEKQQVEPEKNPQGDNFHPGDAPSQALLWEAEVVAKGGTIALIGVYPETVQVFPLGVVMNKNVTLTMGHCPHRKYIPELMSLVSTGMVNPTQILTQHASITSAIDAYKAFDEREDGWVKVELVPATMV